LDQHVIEHEVQLVYATGVDPVEVQKLQLQV
jgi:hypothetical protein